MKLYKTKKSNIHRYGLSAAKDIKEGTKIIQYKGKKITNKESEENKKYRYDITYLFILNKKYLLDGDFKYNTARLVNHSCNPNCEVIDNNGLEIWISAIRNIKKNEELTYDYGFSFDSYYKDYVCKCGSYNCVGYIVREGSRWRIQKSIKLTKNI